jgi:hypothetical protein
VRRLAEQDQASVGDPLKQRVDGGGLDVVDRLGRLADEGREPGRSPRETGAAQASRLLAPPLLPDQRHEAHFGDRLLPVVRFGVSGNTDQRLQRLVGTDGQDQPTADG